MLYLKKLDFQNTGPIKQLSFEMPFDDVSKDPVPLILVGENGVGKSVATSSIAEAFLEFADEAFEFMPRKNLSKRYFKVLSGANITVGASHTTTYLEFEDRESEKKYAFLEKLGKISNDELKEKIHSSLHSKITEGKTEKVFSTDKDYFLEEFGNNSFLYFPATRFEFPYWHNHSDDYDRHFNSVDFYQPGTASVAKDFINTNSLGANKKWLFDLILDSRVAVEKDSSGEIVIKGDKNDIEVAHILSLSVKNIEKLFSTILKKEVEVSLDYRISRLTRLNLKDKNTGLVIVPTLENLSLGQLVLFNLFTSIIRHSDKSLSKSISLNEISGIVVIDEIDLHLHTDLQYEALPALIKLFPKIQFIITTHSPLFLLGMKKEFGNDKFQIRELPDGKIITSDRFGEYKKAFDLYKQTEEFEVELVSDAKDQILPVIFVEGDTDEDYLKKAVDVFGIKELMSDKVTIKWIGRLNASGQPEFTGETALDNTRSFYLANPGMLKCKTILLYDFDSKKDNLDLINLLHVRSVDQNSANTKVIKGIENLFDERLFTENFYKEKSVVQPYGGHSIIPQFQKRDFCNEMCTKKATPETFVNFKPLLEKLKAIL